MHAKVPEYLESTYNMVSQAFPDGICEDEYWVMLFCFMCICQTEIWH